MGQEQSKCRQVLDVEGYNPLCHKNAVREMMESGPARSDTKVFVICISGVYRSGKTFFLNLLKTYMDYFSEHQSDAGWVTSHDIKIAGGNWKKGLDTVTHGIWMYMYPKLIDNKAIILMDCEGSKDIMRSTLTMDNLIHFLGLQLSDVHILNVERSLGAYDLDRLELCVYHADDDSSGNMFERQIFLIRDWGNAGKPYQLDQIAGTAPLPVRKAALGIQKAFRKVEVTSLPFPGYEINKKSERDGITLGKLSDKFLLQARELFYNLVLRLPSEARMNSQEFLEHFEFVSNRAVGKISTPQEAYEETLIKQVFMSCRAHFSAEVEKLKNVSQLTAAQLEDKVTAIYKEAEAKFVDHKRVKNCVISTLTSDYLGFLEESMRLMRGTLKEERLQAELRQLKENQEAVQLDLQAMKSQYERMLIKLHKDKDLFSVSLTKPTEVANYVQEKRKNTMGQQQSNPVSARPPLLLDTGAATKAKLNKAEYTSVLPYSSSAKQRRPHATSPLLKQDPLLTDVDVDEKPIGEGGQGAVYSGKWLQTSVAIKVFCGESSNVEEECNALRELRHPNVVQFFGITKISERKLGIVLELCCGDLRQLSRSSNTSQPSLELILKVVKDAVAGLIYIHSKGMIHMDVKPNNILVKHSIGKLADFGLAEIVSNLQDESQTVVWAGTPLYRAPELYRKEAPTSKADMWSAGLTLLEAMTGRAPYSIVRGRNRVRMADGVAYCKQPGTLVFVGENRSIYEKVLSFDPTRRLSSSEWLNELNNYKL